MVKLRNFFIKLSFYLQFFLKRSKYEESFRSESLDDGKWLLDTWFSIDTKQRFGKVKFVAKLDGKFTETTRPALWLVNSEEFYGEIDIELIEGKKEPYLLFTTWWNPLTNSPEKSLGCTVRRMGVYNKDLIKELRNSYHTYTIDWDRNRVKFYIDDILIARTNNSPAVEMGIVVGEVSIKQVTNSKLIKW
jgi:hypothetical protein